MGWFKLLTAEEGEFYNVPVPDEGTDLVQLKSQMRVSENKSYLKNSNRIFSFIIQLIALQKTSITKKITSVDRDLPHNMSKKDMIRSTDFNFLMVLGKGSFGKVNLKIHFHVNVKLNLVLIEPRSCWLNAKGLMICLPLKF